MPAIWGLAHIQRKGVQNGGRFSEKQLDQEHSSPQRLGLFTQWPELF